MRNTTDETTTDTGTPEAVAPDITESDITESDVVESDADADTPESAESEPDSDNKAMSAEAAKYRRQLRDAQAELERVVAQLDAVQRQQVEHLLADSGVKAAAVWTVTGVAELLNDDGAIDAEKVSAAVDTARERFGIPKRSVGNYIPGIANHPIGMPKGNDWADAFSPAKRR